ncbi:MAG TPA: hypothetical protein VJT78_14605 [Candidatus Dormibacteraeota bacterium]|nr:hypothetical protein [Candidatus Dormibacteraeota bacterium]
MSITHNTNRPALSSSISISIPEFPAYAGTLAVGSVNSLAQVMEVNGSGILTRACGRAG